MKLTLLEIVQDILSSMDSDEVNSISDTVEAAQVAKIVRDSFIDIVDRMEAVESFSVFELEAVNSLKPTMMTVPSDVHSVLWIKYDRRVDAAPVPVWENVYPLPLGEFIERMYGYNPEDSNFVAYTHVMNGDTIDFFAQNDRPPQFYTQLEDNRIVFDSWEVAKEANLQKSKTMCYGKIIPTFTMSDTFIPKLDANQFGLLLNEAKRQAFMELKQTPNPISEQRARRGWIRAQRNKGNIPTHSRYSTYPKYGR